MKRESGIYWVKYNGEWTIGHYDAPWISSAWRYQWLLLGAKEFFVDNELEEIDETPITRKP